VLNPLERWIQISICIYWITLGQPETACSNATRHHPARGTRSAPNTLAAQPGSLTLWVTTGFSPDLSAALSADL